MSSVESLVHKIQEILKGSSIQFADVAFGNRRGLLGSARHTDTTRETNVAGFQPAVSLAERRYLIASITKPIVAMQVVQMAAEGSLSLNDAAGEFVEGFHRGPLRNMTVRHLLTHTSGLPDMLVNNSELREKHATLSKFVEYTAACRPDFPVGTDCRYSSMGFAVLALILERVSGMATSQLLKSRVFEPLGMNDSWLGLPCESVEQLLPTTLPCELPAWQSLESDWNWNSAYWRTFGAPWGGMISTATDLGRLATAMLNASAEPTSAFSSCVIQECMENQSRHIVGLSEVDRLLRPWSYGWRFNWRDHAACFSDFLSESAIGHWGATGTLLWIDPASDRWLAALTNQPWDQSKSVIQRISNLFASHKS